MNYISAVWPTLRYNSYTVAVIIARNMDATSYYLPSTTLSLSDPCSHPDAVKCDTTGKQKKKEKKSLYIIRYTAFNKQLYEFSIEVQDTSMSTCIIFI